MIIRSVNIPRPRVAADRRAFTLVEVITTIVILATLSVVASRLILEGAARYSDSVLNAQLQESASAAMDRIVEELRQIQIKASSSPPVPDITSTFSSTSMTWNSGTSSRTVTYSAGAKQIQFSGAAASNAVLLDNCTAFTITYYDKNNGTITPAGDSTGIRRIGISLTVSSGSNSFSLRTKIYVRTMMIGSGST